MGEDSDKNSTLEKQVLNLYDQLYQSYVLANTSTLEVGPTPGMKDGDLFNELKIVVMDNLETVISVCSCISNYYIVHILCKSCHTHTSIYLLSVCLFVSLLCLSVYPSVCVYRSIYLSICLSVCLSVCPSVCVSDCLSDDV